MATTYSFEEDGTILERYLEQTSQLWNWLRKNLLWKQYQSSQDNGERKGPDFVGARMGRPEKAKRREMSL